MTTTMTHERCIERLSEHLDGALAPDEARAVAGHLAACADCSRVLEELRAVVARAAALEPRPPERDLWPGIAAAIEAPGSGVVPLRAYREEGGRRPSRWRRVTLSVPQLAAAGLALALASGAAAWWARPTATATPGPAVATAAAPDPAVLPAGALPAEGGWAEEVASLERALAAADGLDGATVRVLQRNLEIIDRAIRESREALASDPGNPFLEDHLARAYQRKISTLREANEMAAWTRS